MHQWQTQANQTTVDLDFDTKAVVYKVLWHFQLISAAPNSFKKETRPKWITGFFQIKGLSYEGKGTTNSNNEKQITNNK